MRSQCTLIRARALGMAFVSLTTIAATASAQCVNFWMSMGLATGTNGAVFASVAWDPDGPGPAPTRLVIGGTFTTAGGVLAQKLAMWDPATQTWSAIGGGVSGVVNDQSGVFALAVLPTGELIVGGAFTHAGGMPAGGIARWDGGSWSSLAGGTSGVVYSLLTLANGDLVAGGAFYQAGGVAAQRIARWDGAAWTAFGYGLDHYVWALAQLPNGDLIAAGSFWQCVKRWTGTAWATVGFGLYNGIQALLVMPNGDLVAGGYDGVRRWTGSAWIAIGDADHVAALALLPNGDLVQGGCCQTLQLTRWDGSGWSLLGGGVQFNYGYPVVHTLTTMPNGDLVAGGRFDYAGAVLAGNIATCSTTCPAVATAYGTGCSGSGGVNELTATALPWLDSTFRARANGLAVNSLAVAVYAFGQTTLPMPSVHPLGVAGCELLVQDEILLDFAVANGAIETAISIPNQPMLIGSDFYHQVVPVELGSLANITALTSTNGLVLTVGTF